MKWFKNLPTKSKLFVGFGVLLALLIGISVIGYRSLTAIQEIERKHVDPTSHALVDLSELRTDENRIQTSMLTLTQTKDKADHPRLLNEIEDRKREVDSDLENIKAFLKDRSPKDNILVSALPILTEMEKERAVFSETRGQVISLIAADKTDEARAIQLGIQAERYERMREKRLKLTDMFQKQFESDVAESTQTAEVTIRIFSLVAGASVLLVLWLVWVMSRIIALPLQAVTGVAKRLAVGDLSGQVDAEDRRDEVGDLQQTMQAVSRAVKALIADTARLSKAGVEGRLDVRVDAGQHQGDFRKIVQGVNDTLDAVIGPLNVAAGVINRVAQDEIPEPITERFSGDFEALRNNLNTMTDSLRRVRQKNSEQDWFKTNIAKFASMLQGQRDLQAACKRSLSQLAPLVDAQHGVIFINDGTEGGGVLKLLASYAYRERKHVANQFKPGEGLVGQCLLEKERILLTQVPGDYVKISSGLGESAPLNIVVLPVLFEGAVKAVIELASLQKFSELQLAFLDQFAESLGVVVNTIQAGMRTEDLLEQSRAMTEQLQAQQEELKQTNEELVEKTNELQASEEELKEQQEELKQSNEELEEKAHLLAEQKAVVEQKNQEVERARLALQEKAEQLALPSKYKSEFLANMSHELRTPLNSLLILARQLADNPEGNLTAKQVEYAKTVQGCGNDLLELINDILDLSKIESGAVEIEAVEVVFGELAAFVERTFRHVADEKGLAFTVVLDPQLPAAMRTEERRLQQVVKNLLSNAFKFTEKGEVELSARVATAGWSPDHPVLSRAGTVIALACRDTGIGIPKDKQKIVFEAFQQEDGTTSRKYGGTGLGLSISREIARLLGGEIHLASAPGEGSTFTLYLPLDYTPPPRADRGAASKPDAGTPFVPSAIPAPAAPAAGETPAIDDDRADIRPGEPVLLIVEDDPPFASILVEMAREKGFKPVVATDVEKALALLREHRPAAVTLDLRLPDGDGWVLLDRIKHDPATRHIPVQIVSAAPEEQRGLQMGALSVLAKPVGKEAIEKALADTKDYLQRQVKHLLVVEDSAEAREAIVALIGNGDVKTTAVATGEAALAALARQHFDCMVLDLGLPDMSGFALLDKIKERPELRALPVIVYTGRELTRKEANELRKYSKAVIIKDVKAPDRLLDETALFLHRVQTKLPENQQSMLQAVREDDPVLMGRKVLIVDDDVRNIFALTSVLERKKVQVLSAENGMEGLELLQKAGDVEAVLMDVMMPEMDGYETMRRIRALPQFKKLPILAVTAKAMKGDREKCLEAGANDYITKPVDMDQLLSLLRVWLYK